MTAKQIEQIACSARVWKQYQADRAYMRGTPQVWRPRMTEQQKQAHDQYVISNKLPF